MNYSTTGCEFIYLLFLNAQPTSEALKGAIQLGIGYAVGNLSSKPDRDVLMQDFSVVESVFLPGYALTCSTHLFNLEYICYFNKIMFVSHQ